MLMDVGRMDVVDVVLMGVLSLSAATDLRVGRIFNVITYPAIAMGLFFAMIGLGPELSSAALGGAIGGLSLYLLFVLGWMGGGDVKLMAAVGAFKGFPFILNAMFYSIFLGGACAALVLIWRGDARAVIGDLSVLVRRVARPTGLAVEPIPPRGGSFPFGVAICLGTLTALLLEWRGSGL